ncbi:amidohydrolase [Haloarculaceae archaeon H-GB11]|nr:amidohydrolase [Haloarculaceae archaeon H-GB11]
MTDAADLVLLDGTVHVLDDAGTTAEGVAIRDGEIVRVDKSDEVRHLVGVETEVVDLDGRHVLPGFVDAHTHMLDAGRQLRNADLSACDSPEACLDQLRAGRDERAEWILGFGYDESRWGGSYLTRDDLDDVSTERPVAAVREDMHVVSLNSVALERYRTRMPDRDVNTEDGRATGVVVEDAAGVIYDAIDPGPERARTLLFAAQSRAHELGVTGVHDMVRRSVVPRVYRDLDLAGELSLRVRMNYWADFLDAVEETGLATNHGSDRLEVGAIKTFTDGSIGGATAKLSEPYRESGDTGKWVVPPRELRELVDRVDEAGLQLAIHAIGDEAIAETLDALAETDPSARHRIEHAEVLDDELIARLAASDVIVSAQPNFHKWAREDGLYASRLGDERRVRTNQLGALADAGATLAFGSDCMPMDPLFGVQQAVTAPTEEQRLDVTEAVRAYTRGGAYAGFAEDRQGTVDAGMRADLTVLAESPWEVDPSTIGDVDVAATVVDGAVVYDALR